MANTVNSGLSSGKNNRDFDQINLLAIFTELFKKLWLLILVAVIVGGSCFALSKFLITPTYRASFTAYVNNRSQLSTVQDTISSNDVSASQQLVRAYSKIIVSKNVLSGAAESISSDLSYTQLKNMVTAQVDDTEIITVYVVDSSPEEAYKLASAIANISTIKIADIIEGSSMKIIDMPQKPTSIYKPSYVKNTAIGCLIGVVLAAAYVIVRFLMDDKVKNENDLETRFSLPVVGVIPDMNAIAKNANNYYEYEYAYRNSEIKRSGGKDGKKN